MTNGHDHESAPVAVTSEAVTLCEQVVEARCGYRFGDVQHRNLEDAIKLRVEATASTSVEAYVQLLRSSGDTVGELGDLLSEFTNTETHFFRHIGRFKLLRDRVVPATMERKGARPGPIRILSAGCSSGEEVYSTIITMLEAPEIWAGRRLEVVGCDINKQALQQARRAEYGKWSLRFTPADILRRHFVCVDAENHRYQVAQHVTDYATFKQANLTSEELFDDLTLADFDVVFCCNVIIYLTEVFVDRVIDNLQRMLGDQGFLFMGYTEGLLARRANFEPLWSDDYVTYQRIGSSTRVSDKGRGVVAPRKPAAALPRRAAPAVLAGKPVAVVARPSPPVQDVGRRTEPALAERLEHRYRGALDHCRADRQDVALRDVDGLLEASPFHSRGRLLKGYLLGGRGQMEAATAECTKALDIDPVFAQAYLLRGMLLEQQGDWENAIGEVKKALYLDSSLPLAHFTMAKLRRSAGDREGAVREFASTIRVLRDHPDIAVAADIPVEFDHQVLRQLAESYLKKL